MTASASAWSTAGSAPGDCRRPLRPVGLVVGPAVLAVQAARLVADVLGRPTYLGPFARGSAAHPGAAVGVERRRVAGVDVGGDPSSDRVQTTWNSGPTARAIACPGRVVTRAL